MNFGAAITGDIINSSSLDKRQRESLVRSLKTACARANEAIVKRKITTGQNAVKVYSGIQGSRGLDIFRGESWQLFVDAELGLSASFMLRGYLRGLFGIDTRYSIGIGTYDYIDVDHISRSPGECFTISGQGLDSLKSSQTINISLGEDLKKMRPFATSIARLIDAISTSWTDKQAYACALDLNGKSQEEIATSMEPPITKQAFGKHLAAARWSLIKEALDAFEQGIRMHLP